MATKPRKSAPKRDPVLEILNLGIEVANNRQKDKLTKPNSLNRYLERQNRSR